MKAAIRKNTYDLDKLQQYGRRENLWINGFPEEEGGNLKAKILKIVQATGVEILNGDINVAHRSVPRGTRPRQIICCFVSRNTKKELLKSKKKLRDNDYKNVFMYGPLTPLRAMLLEVMKEHTNVKSAFTREGIIHCNLHNGLHAIIESPDDLLSLVLTE